MNANGLDLALLLRANEEAAAYFRLALLDSEGAGPRRYLAARGLDRALHETEWTVGYAPPGWTRLTDHLRQFGLDDQTLLDAGLVSRTRTGRLIDRFRDRLTFGIRDAHRDLLGFTARSAPTPRGVVPKYLNTPCTVLYDKSHSLFGLGEQVPHMRAGAIPVLVEGPLDALAVDRVSSAGPRGMAAVSPCGTALTGHQAEELRRLSPDSVIVAFDRDEPGARAAARAYALLRPLFTLLTAARLPQGLDPADVLRAGGPTRLQQCLTTEESLATRVIDDLLQTYPDRLSNAETRIACLRAIARVVVTMAPGELAQQAAVLPQLLNLSQRTVTRELIDAACPDPPTRSRPESGYRNRGCSGQARKL